MVSHPLAVPAQTGGGGGRRATPRRFDGGKLLYWPEDDGSCSLDGLLDKHAMTFETQCGLVLFDGARCHAVTPFQAGG